MVAQILPSVQTIETWEKWESPLIRSPRSADPNYTGIPRLAATDVP